MPFNFAWKIIVLVEMKSSYKLEVQASAYNFFHGVRVVDITK